MSTPDVLMIQLCLDKYFDRSYTRPFIWYYIIQPKIMINCIRPNKTAAEIAYITKKTWFTCYPLPQRIVVDRSTEFMANFLKLCQNDYGLKKKSITTRNYHSK